MLWLTINGRMTKKNLGGKYLIDKIHIIAHIPEQVENEIKAAYEKSGWMFRLNSYGCQKFRQGYLAARGFEKYKQQ